MEADSDSSDDEEEVKDGEDVPQLIKPEKKGPVIDDDGFQVITSDKKGRRK